jgi:uncharacterized protein YkwD
VAPPRQGVVPSARADSAGRGDGAATVVADIEPRVFVLANQLRDYAGVPELELRLDLIDLARSHALDMANRGYFSHYSPEGDGPGDRADHRGVPYECLGENLARVRNSSDPATLSLTGWLRSPSHRRILLDEREVGYLYTGIGVAQAPDGTLYVAQVFVR